MESKVCVTIAASSSSELISKLEGLENEHNFFELRLDGLENLSPELIEQIVKTRKSKLILTLRSKNEGGSFEGSDQEYKQIINICFSQSNAYVDVELSFLKRNNIFKDSNLDQSRAIVSYHNFNETPDEQQLKSIIDMMKRLSPMAIYKIACLSQNMEQVLRLIDLQKAQNPNSSIVISMGESGQLLRLIGPSIGAFTSFASAELSSVAPGQLYYKDMLRIFNAMESTKNGRK